MTTVVINNKKYNVKELTYPDFITMEDNGLTIDDLETGKKFFTIAAVFVCIATGCNRDQAADLLTQHVMGGGEIKDIYKAFEKAVDESSFFAKLIADKKAEKKAEV